MKRSKELDWTRVLQERLRDAALPMDAGFTVLPAAESSRRAAGNYFPDKFAGKPISAPLSAAGSSRGRAVWPWWALAGVAAAAVAAVLLLRPSPAAVNPVPAGDSLVAQSIEPTPSADDSRHGNLPDRAAGKPISAPLSAAGREESARPPRETNPSSNVAQNEEEIPDQVRNDRDEGTDARTEQKPDYPEQVQSLSEQAMADLTEFPEELAQPRKKQARRVSLRVQAATTGISFSNGALPMSVLKTVEEPGQWFLLSAQDGELDMYNDYASSIGYGTTIINSPQSEGAKWMYVQGVSEMKNNVVMVHQAPAVPITFGLSLSLSLSRSWALSAGLDYTQRAGNRVYLNVPLSLTLHYLGIPVDLQYYFNPENRWRFYLGAGVHAAKCIYATGGEPLRDPVLFSGNLAAGTDFRLFPGVRLYVAPALTGHFNRSAYVNDWDDRLQFQLRAGLSFDL